MRNIFKKSFLFIATGLLATNLFAQKTYTFDDGVALATDWTVNKDVPSGGTGDCTIAAPSKFSAKNGNYLYFVFENKSKITITITSTASYNNISNIKFDAVSSDNSKPSWTLNIVDDNGNIVKNVYSDYGTKDNFNTGGTSKWGVSNSAINPAASGHIQLVLYASSSGKYAAIDNLEVTYQAGPSTDATLKSLSYNGTAVTGFSANTLNYEVELPAGTTAIPNIAATATDAAATVSVTPPTSLPGNATVTVTAEDGTTTKTYTITFTLASSLPKVTSATWTNIKGTATIDQVNKTITGKVINGSSLTSITPQFTGDNIASWTPTAAQNFANGAVNYTFKNSTNETTVYAVTITEAPAVSTDATLKSLTYGGTAVPGFSPSVYSYNIELTAGVKTPPTIAATANESHATVNITQASSVPGVGKVEVTAEDGETKLTYTINYTVAVPSSNLTTHVPEIYEAKTSEGGYSGSLSVFNGREYEVYYASFTEEGALSVTVDPMQKSEGITTSLSDYHCKATDGWLEMETSTSKSNYTMSATDEFAAGSSAIHKLLNDAYYKIHIKGFDQFSFYGKDNNADASKGKHFEVYVDGMLQPMTLASSAKIRRFDISTGEHVIEVRGIGGSNNEFYGFSLRVAQEPKLKWLKGNDTTQTIMQTTAIRSVKYITKYNNIPGAETKLIWDGSEANGIVFDKTSGSTLCDTFSLHGTANCPVGVYNFHVAAFYNGVETSRKAGKVTVTSDIIATSDVKVEVYQNELMDPISFNYYALSANDVKLTWANGQPNGISGSGADGRYTISGTPTQISPLPKTFPFSITVTGADTVIQGEIKVKELNYGTNPILYLHKHNGSYDTDGVYAYLTGKGKNLIARKAKEDGLRPEEQYAMYKWIIISEDADADNKEVLAIIRGGANLPVLNLKGFTYAGGRLGWGEPNNGAIDTTAAKEKGCNIWIEQPSHPIFKNMTNISKNTKVKILSGYAHNGVMPIAITNAENTLCLATGQTRSIENYYAEGDMQTAIHEVPTQISGSKKYICLPLAREAQLSTQGQKLIDGIEEYLLSNAESGITPPTLEIQKFSISDIDANIDQAENTITLRLTEEKFSQLDSLRSVTPKITLADQYTHVLPSSNEKLDLRYMYVIPKTFVVTDYISRRTYDFMIELYDPYESIDQVYEAGQWVNIFDIYGRKVATTNEDIYSMILPRGMYIVVTESGKTLKIMK